MNKLFDSEFSIIEPALIICFITLVISFGSLITPFPSGVDEEYEIVPENGVLIDISDTSNSPMYLFNKKIDEESYETVYASVDDCIKHKISADEIPHVVVSYNEIPSWFPVYVDTKYDIYLPETSEEYT